ncbi:DUF4395 domain-containing protein [Halobacillus litoralis]|uniref:DUF4395 domain-containing protein n=1 Tax=Halobacillus litoralis TaxID=45668 RepID=UPI001CD5122C|nr:DUF4395 domain-containing protein [Halobacillus litoralis]MCA0972014.1 DUF4395 domain-containing protein [Halobacillus litoralis]
MGIPKPLVQLNQTFIVLTVFIGLFEPIVLALPFAVGAITLITRKNPVIAIGKRFLKKPMNSYIPEDPDQQRFNQWIATVCLGLSLLFFGIGWQTLGYAFSMMVMAAAGTALMGYCIGCTIRFRYMMWKHKRLNTNH